MNRITGLAMLVLALAFTQSCKKERSAEEVAAIAQAKADSTDSANVSEKNARRVRFEEQAAIKKEKRRLALEESIKKGVSYKDAKGKVIYIKADEMPTYTGGEAEMTKYLQDNVQYPQAAKDNGDEGTVYVDFVIDKTGKVTDVVATDSVNSDVNPLLIDESKRLVSSMPNWTPAKQKGKAVDVAYSIPITFQLQ
jgi:periplasmic protein TonB